MKVERKCVGLEIIIDEQTQVAEVRPLYEAVIAKKEPWWNKLWLFTVAGCFMTTTLTAANWNWAQVLYVTILQTCTVILLWLFLHKEKFMIVKPPEKINVYVKKKAEDGI